MQKIFAVMQIAAGLFTTGAEIVAMVKGKNSLTEEELQAIIDKQDKAIAESRAKLVALIG